MKIKTIGLTIALVVMSTPSMAADKNQDQFFERINALCGKAFTGAVEDTSGSDQYRGRKFLLHIRDCSDARIKIPLHIDDNSSRILILTKGTSSIRLQHDHRQEDGSSDDMTMYGGYANAFSTDSSANVQHFLENPQSIEITKKHAPTRTYPSVWSIILNDDHIIYQVVRPGRTIKAKFYFKDTATDIPKAWDLNSSSH